MNVVTYLFLALDKIILKQDVNVAGELKRFLMDAAQIEFAVKFPIRQFQYTQSMKSTFKNLAPSNQEPIHFNN